MLLFVVSAIEAKYFFKGVSNIEEIGYSNTKGKNSLKLSCMNIRGLCSNFVDCESFLASNSPDILALCETSLDDSIDSGNFSLRGYLPVIRKDSSTHAWFCSFC